MLSFQYRLWCYQYYHYFHYLYHFHHHLLVYVRSQLFHLPLVLLLPFVLLGFVSQATYTAVKMFVAGTVVSMIIQFSHPRVGKHTP